MAFLGFFSKRDKHKAQDASTIQSTSAASDVDPSEPDYVVPSSSHAHSIYSGPPGASSSKLKLGFKAKKFPAAPRTDSSLLSPPSAAFLGIRSESENNLLSPPPPRSAVFNGYADPTSAHSTRSLPTQPLSHSRSNSKEYVDLGSETPLPVPPKPSKGGLFSWAHRERKKSKPPLPTSPPAPSPLPDISLDSESFNLRSFRHVRPASPSKNDSPSAMLPPARPRPREGSFVSDSSQRISVAAFREAQARRSAANSPVPSFSHDAYSPGSSTGLRPPSTFALRNSRSISVSGESDTDESDEDQQSEASSTLKPRRHRTHKQPHTSPIASPGKKSVSELGHRTIRVNPPVPPRMVASASTNASFAPSGTSLRDGASARPRASASTSALQPNAAARRASLLAAQQQPRNQPPTKPNLTSSPAPASATRPPPQKARSLLHRSSSSSTSSSSSSSSSDSDDAPLATLMAPKRPGSSASSAPSTSRPRALSRPRPLIDISGISPTPPSFADADRPPLPAKDSPASSPKVTTPGHASKPSLNDRLQRLAKGAGRSVDNVADQDAAKEAEKGRGRERKTPTRSQTQPVEALPLLSSASPSPSPGPSRKMNGRSMSSPNATFAEVKQTSDAPPIVPTAIRTRTPPPSFAVTSRPSSQFSQSNQSDSQQPAPRTSEETVRLGRARTSTLISDGDLASNRGFTGGGLLAGGTIPSPSTSSPPSAGQGRVRPRVGTSVSSSPPSRSPPGPSPADTRSHPHVRASQLSQELPPPRLVTRSSSPEKSRSPATPASASRPTLVPKSALKPSSQGSSASEIPGNGRSRTTSLAGYPAVSTPPTKPFAGTGYGFGLRGNSPASSTGDSSSGRTPITPVDGSDLSAISAKRGHRKSSSVTFDEPDRGRSTAREREKPETSDPEESRRRERRRSEAKAALELGKIVNGRGPIATDDDDNALGNMGPRMSMFKPMMAAGMSQMGGINVTPPSPMAWSPQTPQGMMNPMFAQQNADPTFLAAHQQAMMAAKQAFQMAIAQQALAAANEEWERGSTATSAYGGFGGMGGGMFPGASPGFGMNMGMGMPWPMQMFPSSQSMYAGSVIGGSELGVSPQARGPGWGSRSMSGEQGTYTGSAAERASMLLRNSQLGAVGGFSGARSEVGGPTSRSGQRPRVKTNPSDAPLPSPHKNRGGPPPSSWNARTNKPA